ATSISGPQVVTITVTDDNTNSTQCTFSVLPDDNTDPTVMCPANIPVSFNAQCQYNLGAYTSLGIASDNCDQNPTVTQNPVSGTLIGTTTTVTLTAMDANGNTGTCTLDVVPTDGTNPTITCPGDQNVSFTAGCDYDLLDYTSLASVDDNCDNAPTVAQSPVSTTTITTSTTVTLTVIDASSNVSSCTFDVVPTDDSDPVLSCPADTPVAFDANCQYSLPDYIGLTTISDNCDLSPALAQSPILGTLITGLTEVTISATDASGNISTCTFDIIPSDAVVPTIACPVAQTVSSNPSCQFAIIDYTSVATANDNCDQVVDITQSPGSGTIITVPTTVTLTATDDAVNTADCTFLVTPADNDNPSITCPGDQLEDFDADCEFDIIDYTGLASASDNCSATPAVTQDVSVSTIVVGTTTITLTATDTDLNTATCTFDVIPADNTAPIVTCPANQEETFGAQCQFILPSYLPSASTSDNCGLPTVAQSPVAGTVIGGNTVVTITSTDASGNIGTCTFAVSVSDVTNPTVICPADITEAFDASCTFDLLDYTNLASVTDNCDVAPFTVSQSPVATTTISGITTITLSVTDAESNTATCTFQVLPIDNENPSLICPADATVSFDANCMFILADYTSSVTADDNCDNNLDLVQAPIATSTLTLNTVVTITATDDAGNSTDCSFNVNPIDDVDPTLACPADYAVNANSNCEYTVPDLTSGATLSDNCDNTPFIVQSPTIGSTATGATVVTLTATDDAGNVSTCNFTITVSDNEVPTLTCPSDQLEALTAICDFSVPNYSVLVLSTDNCDTDVALVQSPVSGSIVSSNTTVTFTGTDDNLNATTCSFLIVLEDQTNPSIVCPGDQTVTLGANCQFVIQDYTGLSTSSDNCDPSLSVTQSPLAGSLIGGSTVVTISSEDASGNVGTCTFSVLPNDTEDPTILACPNNIVQDNDPAICGSVVTYATVTAIDNCAGIVVPALMAGGASGSVFDEGTTTVTYVATDDNGNTAECEFDVTINDTEDPIVLCPADMNVNIDAGTCGALVTYAAPTVTDNCPAPTTPALDAGLASGATFPIGATVNTYSSMDATGNTSSCTFTVTVADNENPTITCPGDVVVGNDLGNCDAIVTYNLPTVDDNCPGEVGPTLEAGGASGTVFVFGTTTVTYSVVDAAANVNDCSFTVTINDTEDPVLTCPNDTSINCDATVVYDLPVVSDNCAIGLVAVETSPAGGGFTLGTNLVEFSAADGNGNTGVCSFTVTVIDTVAPAITCPANQVASFDASCELSAPDYTSLATSTDNCDATPVITQSPTAGSTITGTATITLTSEDVSGNTTSCTFDVIDSTLPTIACPASVVVGSDINCQFTLLDYTATTTSSDNCGGVALTQSPLAGTLISSLTTVTVTSTDNFGNVNSCQFTVDLIDNINPSISCIGNQTVQFDASCMHELIDYSGSIGTSDNCDASVTVTQDPVATTLVAGVTTVTMTATDDSFNSVTCSFTVSPIDNIAPTITCPALQLVDFDANCEFALADYTGDGTTADNCSAVIVTQSPAIASIQTANTVVTLTAEDVNGNMASCAFVVIPEDNIDPVIVCPSDLAVDFDANCEYTLMDYTVMGTPADNCSSVFSVTQSPSSGQAVTGSAVITLTVNDGNGNSSTCTFNVSPSDNTPPSITCIADQEVIFDENCQFEISDYNGTPSTSDNCSSSITVTQSPASGSFISGPTSITLTADDGNGNTATCSFMVLPEDLTNPTIACPASFDVQFGSQGCSYLMSDLTSLVTADDNCASLVTITQNPVIGTVVTDTLSVTFTADDGNGNTASCSFDVNPSDDTEPTAICPGDLTVDFNENCEFVIPDYKPEVIAADNCGFTNITQSPAIGTIITEPTEIVITVDDGNGNSTGCSFTVSPEDNLAPTLACPNNMTESLDANCQFEMPDYTAMATAEDNCTDLMIINQFPPLGTVILASQVVTLSIVDNAGNDAECSFVVLPEDDSNPVIDACPDDQLASLGANCELLMPDFSGLITATDNCDISLDYQQLPLAGSAVAGVGTYLITVGAIDASGNAALCEFNLFVTDDSNPTVACPEDQTIELNANCQFEVPDYTALAVGADACGSVTLTQSPLAGAIITTQLNATVIVEDENGNTSSCTFFVDIVEMTATVVGTNATCQGGSDGAATVTVLGGNAPYTEDWGGFNPAALAAGTYSVTVTDVNGCSTTASVTIEDGPLFEIEIDPSGDVVICDGDLVSLNAGSGYAAYDWSTGASVQTITVSSEASYWVTVTNADGCLSNTDTVNVSFFDEPLPTVVSTTDGIISCSNDTASSYQWYLNGGPIDGATDSYHCPLGSGNYYVVITDANGCTVSSIISEYTYDEDSPCATGIDEHGLTLDVYPNPSTGLFSVKYSLESQKDMKLTVFDLLGQQVTDNVIISFQNGTSVIDLSNQADGIYTLRIELEDNKVLQQRLVLVK
ncbi:MAG: hypothetical protein ACI9EQ_000280, partial [Bacteroidia bacterium]